MAVGVLVVLVVVVGVVGSDKQPPSPWQPARPPPPLPRQQLPAAHRGYPPSPLGPGSPPAAGAQRGPPRPVLPDQKRAKLATRLWQRMRHWEKLSDPDSEVNGTDGEIRPEPSSRGCYSTVQEEEAGEVEDGRLWKVEVPQGVNSAATGATQIISA